MNAMVDYFVRVGDALSQLVNVTLLFGDSANESISGRAYRQRNEYQRWCFAYKMINALFFFQDDHCRESYEADVLRAIRLLERNRT
jgi:hypothetical protein